VAVLALAAAAIAILIWNGSDTPLQPPSVDEEHRMPITTPVPESDRPDLWEEPNPPAPPE